MQVRVFADPVQASGGPAWPARIDPARHAEPTAHPDRSRDVFMPTLVPSDPPSLVPSVIPSRSPGCSPPRSSRSSAPASAEIEADDADATRLPPPQLAGAHQPRRRPLPWAQLLMRVFFVDALSCPRCASPMVVLALLSDPPVVQKILRHLGLPAEAPPLAPAILAASDGPLFEDGEREWDATGTVSRAPP
jgi:hypothetical protein